jgi:hypothetical protein
MPERPFQAEQAKKYSGKKKPELGLLSFVSLCFFFRWRNLATLTYPA